MNYKSSEKHNTTSRDHSTFTLLLCSTYTLSFNPTENLLQGDQFKIISALIAYHQLNFLNPNNKRS